MLGFLAAFPWGRCSLGNLCIRHVQYSRAAVLDPYFAALDPAYREASLDGFAPEHTTASADRVNWDLHHISLTFLSQSESLDRRVTETTVTVGPECEW
jgi:hypothetical protein